MRAATVIVGAIAVSSCLIALALLLTSDSGDSTDTSARHPARERVAPTKAGAGGADSAPAAGPVECNVEVTVEGTSCFLGKSVLAAFREEGPSAGTVTAVDPQSGEEVDLRCAGTAPTICATGGITIYLAPTEG